MKIRNWIRKAGYLLAGGLFCLGIFAGDTNVMAAKAEKPPQAYDEIVIVGDSRTVQMSEAVHTEDTTFIAQKGAKLSWFQQTGIQQLYQTVNNEKSQAVVFHLGVNDLKRLTGNSQAVQAAQRYVPYLNGLLPQLQEMNCDVYFMAVTPVDEDMLKKNGIGIFRNTYIREFNKVLQTQLDPDIEYIDAHTYLRKIGMKTWDGLHYRASTYINVYNYCLDQISKRKPVHEYTQWWYVSAEDRWIPVAHNGKKYRNQWFNYKGDWYFANKNGELVEKEGFQYIEGDWYYFRTDTKVMRKGQWANLGKNRFYFHEDGKLASGWTKIDGKTYYFLESTKKKHNGQLQRSQWIGDRYVNKDGVWTKTREDKKK